MSRLISMKFKLPKYSCDLSKGIPIGNMVVSSVRFSSNNSNADARLTPSDVQWDMQRIIREFGRPAKLPKTRGTSAGRQKGEPSGRRNPLPMIKKGEKVPEKGRLGPYEQASKLKKSSKYGCAQRSQQYRFVQSTNYLKKAFLLRKHVFARRFIARLTLPANEKLFGFCN